MLCVFCGHKILPWWRNIHIIHEIVSAFISEHFWNWSVSGKEISVNSTHSKHLKIEKKHSVSMLHIYWIKLEALIKMFCNFYFSCFMSILTYFYFIFNSFQLYCFLIQIYLKGSQMEEWGNISNTGGSTFSGWSASQCGFDGAIRHLISVCANRMSLWHFSVCSSGVAI